MGGPFTKLSCQEKLIKVVTKSITLREIYNFGKDCSLSLKFQVKTDPVSSIVQFQVKGSNWKIVRKVLHEVGGMRRRRYIFPDRSER